MVVSATAAFRKAQTIESISPYQVIALLLDGALERIDQAVGRITEGELEEADILIEKIMGIITGLREHLNKEQGGDLANNLDTLYDYILEKLHLITLDDSLQTLKEVKELLEEVHQGWQGIEEEVELEVEN